MKTHKTLSETDAMPGGAGGNESFGQNHEVSRFYGWLILSRELDHVGNDESDFQRQ